MKQRTLLRITYWVGAIVDFIMAFLVLIPEKMGVGSYVLPMGLVSASAISWGILLIIADRKPIERRWVLIPVIIIAVFSGFGVGSYALITNLLPLKRIIPEFASAALISFLYTFCYLYTRNASEPTNRSLAQEIDLKKYSSEQSQIKWLRISYWTGAIADFVVAILVLIPEWARIDRFVYPMGLMSVIAFSWGILLIMAAKKPIERRWVLVPTMNIVLLLVSAVFSSLFIVRLPLYQILLTVVFGSAVFSVSLYSYLSSRNQY